MLEDGTVSKSFRQRLLDNLRGVYMMEDWAGVHTTAFLCQNVFLLEKPL